MKKQMILLTAATMVLLLTGCGGMTKEKLLKEMESAAEGKTLSEMSLDFDMDMGISTQGITVDVGMNMDMGIQINTEEKTAYLDMNMDIEAVDETMSESMQLYMLPEDDVLVGYVHTDSTDTWEKQDLGTDLSAFEEASGEESSGSVLSGVDAKNITLAKETEDLDGTEVYVLSYTMTGEEIQKAFDESEYSHTIENAIKENGLEDIEGMEELAKLFDFDFTSMNVPVTVYVDAKSYLPVQMSLDIEGLEEFLNPILSGVMAMTGEEMELTMSVDTLNIICTDFGYDTVEVPALPEGAKEAAMASLDANTYIIEESGDSVSITVPEGWTVVDSSENRLVLNRNDGSQEVWYTMYTGLYGSAFYNHVEQNFAIPYLEEGIYDSHGHLDLDVDFGGAWVRRTDGIHMSFGWNSIGESGHVFVEMVDYTGQDFKTTITPMLEIIQELP